MTRKKQIIIPILILVVGTAGFFGLTAMKKPPEEKKKKNNTPIVAIEAINLAPLTLQVDSYGDVQPKYKTTLVSQVSGEIVELSKVFVRGGFVKKGQLLARIDPIDYEAALIDAQATMATAMSALENERALGQVAEREWKQINDTSPTELSLRKPQLAKELARVKSGQAAVLRAERNVERTEIRAPYDAMIESRNIGLGSFVAVGTSIGKILGTDTAEVRLPVADNHLKYLVNQGAGAKVVLTGVFGGFTATWPAKIVRNEGVIDAKSRMNFLVAEVNDPYHLVSNKEGTEIHVSKKPLRFGAYVSAHIEGSLINNITLVPRHLVVGEKVAILDSDSKLNFTPIEIVREQGAFVVANGLKQGDRLITSALDYPMQGMQLALAVEETAGEVVEDPNKTKEAIEASTVKE